MSLGKGVFVFFLLVFLDAVLVVGIVRNTIKMVSEVT